MDSPKLPLPNMSKESLIRQCKDLDHKLKQSAEYGSYLQKEHDQLKSELKVIGARLKLAIEACEGLNTEKETIEKELEETKSQLKEAEQEVIQLKKDMKKQREHIKTLLKAAERDKERLEESKAKKRTLDGKLKTMSHTVNELEVKVNSLEEQSLLNDKQITDLKSTNKELQADIVSRDATIKELKQSKQSAEAELIEIRKVVENFKNEVESLESGQSDMGKVHMCRVQTLELDIEDQREEIDKLKKERQVGLMSEESLKKGCNSLKSDLILLNDKYMALQMASNRLEIDKKNLVKEQQRLTAENSKLIKNKEHLIDENEKMKLSIHDLKAAIRHLEEENEELLMIKGMKEKLVEDHDDLKMNYLHLEEDMGSIKEANEELSKQYQLMKTKYEHIMQQLGYLKQAKQELDRQNRQLEADQQQCATELSNTNHKAADLENMLKITEDKYRFMEEEKISVMGERDEVKRQLDEMRVSYHNIKQQLQAQLEQNNKLTVEHTDLKNKSAQLGHQVETLKSAKSQLENKMSSLSETGSNIKQQLMLVTNDLEIMSKKYEESTDKLHRMATELNDMEQLKCKWQDNCSALEDKLYANQNELSLTKKAHADVRSKYSELQASHRDLKAELSRVEKSKNELDNSYMELKSHYNQTKQDLALMKDMVHQLDDEHSELKGKYAHVNQQLSEALQAKSTIEGDHAGLVAEYEALRRQYTDVSMLREKLERRQAELKDKCLQTEENYQQAKNMLVQLQDSHMMLNGKHHQTQLELSHVEDAKDQLQIEHDSLADHHQKVGRQMEALQCSKTKLDHEHSELKGMYSQAKLELAQTHDELDAAENGLMDLKGKHQQTKQQLSAMQQARDDKDRQTVELRNTVNQTSDELFASRSAERQLGEQCVELNEQLNSAQAELDGSRETKERLGDQLIEQKGAYNKTKMELEAVTQTKNMLAETVSELKGQCASTREKLVSTKSARDVAEDELKEVRQECYKRQHQLELSKEAKRKVDELFLELKAIHTKTVDDLDKATQSKSSVENERAHLSDRCTVLKEQLDELKEYAAKLEKRLSEMNGKYSSSSSELVAVQEERDAIQRSSNEMKQECCTHKQELKTLRKTRLTLESERDKQLLDMEKLRSDLKEMQLALARLEDVYRQYKTETETELAALREYQKQTPESPEKARHQLQVVAYASLIGKHNTLRKAHETLKMHVVSGQSSGTTMETLMEGKDELMAENARLGHERATMEKGMELMRLNEVALREKLADHEVSMSTTKKNTDGKEEELKQMLNTARGAKNKTERVLIKERERYDRNLARCRTEALSHIGIGAVDAGQIVDALSGEEQRYRHLQDELRLAYEENDLMQLRAEHLSTECSLYDSHVRDLQRQVDAQRVQLQDATREHRETIGILGELRLEHDLNRIQNEGEAGRRPLLAMRPVMTSSELSLNMADSSGEARRLDLDDSRIRTELMPEVDGHRALEIKHFEMLDELIRLRKALDREKEEHGLKTSELAARDKLKLLSPRDARLLNTSSHTPEELYSIKERLIMLMKHNFDLQKEKELMKEHLTRQEGLVHGLRTVNVGGREAKISPLMELGLSDIGLQQIRLLQEQRDDLERALKKHSGKDEKIADLADGKRRVESELRREQDRLREKWHEKELLEVELLREKLATERHARSYHQLEELVRRRDAIERQLADNRGRLGAPPAVAVGTEPELGLSAAPAYSAVLASLWRPGSTLHQRVASLEGEMGAVVRDIDHKLRLRDANIQVGDTCIPLELYKRREMAAAAAAAAYTTLCCGCKIDGFGRDARIACPYHSAVENLRSHLNKQHTGITSPTGKKKTLLTAGYR